ncbi:hypothetical protein J6590_088699 [Homalodisca vitripennis]|nr:hypothetical protein J6590_088699 [Homalodisca vitripennis]
MGTNGLKVSSEPPPLAGLTDYLQGQDHSAITHHSARLSLATLAKEYKELQLSDVKS